jgi:hypothetical protein
MTKRSPVAVFFLPMITFGIYSLVWTVKTKDEMVAKGADIPTAWALIIPIWNLIFLWKYCQGVEKVTKGAMGAGLALVMLWFLGTIGMAMIQSKFNAVE